MIISFLAHTLKCLTLMLALHPIHVSVTEIEFDSKDKALEIMMRVFIDDLELTLRNKLNQPELDILNPKNGLSTDQMVSDYLKDHFKVSLDNKPQKTVYLGHERDAEAFVFYIEVTNVKKWKTIQVFNNIITETHDDQSNLVHVTAGEIIRSLRLTRNTPADKLTFDSK
jgi:hypothetical protein